MHQFGELQVIFGPNIINRHFLNHNFWFIPGVDVPMPYTKSLEIAALPQIHDVVHAVNKVLGVK